MKKVLVGFVLFCAVLPVFGQKSPVFKGYSGYLGALMDLSVRFDTLPYFPSENIQFFKPVDPWKEWKLVENFAFGKDRGDLPMIADLRALHPYFRDKISELINICRSHGVDLAVVESYRTHAKQSEYFGMGRKYTRSAGGKSRHQYGLAVDLVPIIDGEPQWDNVPLWKKIGSVGERLGLQWGGRWRAPYDPAHFEWSGGMTSVHLSKGLNPHIPRSSQYPCIEEDLQQLKNYWNAWESEQLIMSQTLKQLRSLSSNL